MSAPSKRMRNVEITGQEAIEVSEECREASKAVGSARAMAMELRWVGDDAEWMAQRAVRITTQNESVQHRWLKTRRVSTRSTNAIQRTYLGHLHHLPLTIYIPPTSQTHHVAEDD